MKYIRQCTFSSNFCNDWEFPCFWAADIKRKVQNQIKNETCFEVRGGCQRKSPLSFFIILHIPLRLFSFVQPKFLSHCIAVPVTLLSGWWSSQESKKHSRDDLVEQLITSPGVIFRSVFKLLISTNACLSDMFYIRLGLILFNISLMRCSMWGNIKVIILT